LCDEQGCRYPLVIETSHGEQRLSGLHALFCNYSLDSLPSTVLRTHRRRNGSPRCLRFPESRSICRWP